MPEGPNGRQLDAISSITVQGLKSIRDRTTIEVRPLTLLAGANSSGKSSMMQGLLLLKQTAEATYDPGALKLDGPNVLFADASDMLSRIGDDQPADALVLGLALSSGFGFDVEYGPAIGGFRVRGGAIGEGGSRTALSLAGPLDLGWVADVLASSGPERQRLMYVTPASGGLGYSTIVRGEHGEISEVPPDDSRMLTPMDPVRQLSHVRALRGSPAREYPSAGAGPPFRGPFEPYCASLLSRWAEANDPRAEGASDWLARLGLTSKVAAERLSDTRIRLQVGRTLTAANGAGNDLVNIADVGFGVSQVLPVVLACLASKPGATVYIEQPEIHLHPRAHLALADLLVETAQRGVRVIAETHSSLLLLAVQTAVATGGLPPGDVVLHWFERDDRGVTQSTPAELDAAGAFGAWPADFDSVELGAQRAYLDAHDKVRMGASR